MHQSSPTAAIQTSPELNYYPEEAIKIRLDGYNQWAVENTAKMGTLEGERLHYVIDALEDDIDFETQTEEEEDADDYDLLPKDEDIADVALHWAALGGSSPEIGQELVARLQSTASKWDAKIAAIQDYLAEIRQDQLFKEVMNSQLKYVMGAPTLSEEQLDKLRAGTFPEEVHSRVIAPEAELVIRTSINKAESMLSAYFDLPQQVDIILFPRGLLSVGEPSVRPDLTIELHDRPSYIVQTKFGPLHRFGPIAANAEIVIHEFAHVVSYTALGENPVFQRVAEAFAETTTSPLVGEDSYEQARVRRELRSHAWNNLNTHAEAYLELFSDLTSCAVLDNGQAFAGAFWPEAQKSIRDYTSKEPCNVEDETDPHLQLVPAGRHIWQEFFADVPSVEKVQRIRVVLDVMNTEITRSYESGTPPSVTERNNALIKAVAVAMNNLKDKPGCVIPRVGSASDNTYFHSLECITRMHRQVKGNHPGTGSLRTPEKGHQQPPTGLTISLPSAA